MIHVPPTYAPPSIFKNKLYHNVCSASEREITAQVLLFKMRCDGNY